jgi:hypothetical protein
VIERRGKLSRITLTDLPEVSDASEAAG